jgi:type II secretory pathway pseudopilin PulG
MNPTRHARARLTAGGFSLVEVMLALGIVVVGLLAILALVPIGLRTNSETRQETASTLLLSAIEADLNGIPAGSTNSTPIFQLPSPRVAVPPDPSSEIYAVYEDWQIIPYASGTPPDRNSDGAPAMCRLIYERQGQAAQSLEQPYRVRLRMSWPAAAAPENAAFTFETILAFRP